MLLVSSLHVHMMILCLSLDSLTNNLLSQKRGVVPANNGNLKSVTEWYYDLFNQNITEFSEVLIIGS